MKTEFKCHLRLSNGRRAGGDPSKRLGDKRPLLNMALTAGKIRRWARVPKSAPRWRAREPQEPGSPRDRGPQDLLPGRELEWGGAGCKTTSYLPSQHGPRAPSPEPRPERLVLFPSDFFFVGGPVASASLSCKVTDLQAAC